MSADPARYRQSLIDALTDDGLEEVTLRLARPEYPNAYRTGRGADGGVDVLSDLELPYAARTRTELSVVGAIIGA